MKLMSENLDTVGVMARSVADCALFAGAVAGRDLGEPDVRPERAPRIGVCRSPAWDKALPETQTLLGRIASALARAGASVVDRELSADVAAIEAAHPIVVNHESARALGWELANARDQISEGLRERLEFGLARTEVAVAEAHAVFGTAQRAFPACIEGLDALVTPSAPGQAPAGLEWTGDPAFNLIWTACTCLASRCPPARVRTVCHSASRSSPGSARTGRRWPWRSGLPRRLPECGGHLRGDSDQCARRGKLPFLPTRLFASRMKRRQRSAIYAAPRRSTWRRSGQHDQARPARRTSIRLEVPNHILIAT